MAPGTADATAVAMAHEDWPEPRQSGIRDVHEQECLRCEAIRSGKVDDTIPNHHRSCRWHLVGRDPTPAELLARSPY